MKNRKYIESMEQVGFSSDADFMNSLKRKITSEQAQKVVLHRRTIGTVQNKWLALAGVVLIVIVLTVGTRGQAFAKIQSLLQQLNRISQENYTKHYADYKQSVDWNWDTGVSKLSVSEVALSEHSFMMKCKTELYDEELLAAGEGASISDFSLEVRAGKKAYRFELPFVVKANSGEGKEIAIYHVDTDDVHDSLEYFTGRELSCIFHYGEKKSEVYHVSIDACYQETGYEMNQSLGGFDGIPKMKIEKVVYNGVFYQMYTDQTEEDNEMTQIDDAGNGVIYTVCAKQGKGEWKLLRGSARSSDIEQVEPGQNMYFIESEKTDQEMQVALSRTEFKNWKGSVEKMNIVGDEITLKAN